MHAVNLWLCGIALCCEGRRHAWSTKRRKMYLPRVTSSPSATLSAAGQPDIRLPGFTKISRKCITKLALQSFRARSYTATWMTRPISYVANPYFCFATMSGKATSSFVTLVSQLTLAVPSGNLLNKTALSSDVRATIVPQVKCLRRFFKTIRWRTRWLTIASVSWMKLTKLLNFFHFCGLCTWYSKNKHIALYQWEWVTSSTRPVLLSIRLYEPTQE